MDGLLVTQTGIEDTLIADEVATGYCAVVVTDLGPPTGGGGAVMGRDRPKRGSGRTPGPSRHGRSENGRGVPMLVVVLADDVPLTEQGKPDRAAILADSGSTPVG